MKRVFNIKSRKREQRILFSTLEVGIVFRSDDTRMGKGQGIVCGDVEGTGPWDLGVGIGKET